MQLLPFRQHKILDQMRWENALGSPEDGLFKNIEQDKVQSFGEALSLALTKIVRETDY